MGADADPLKVGRKHSLRLIRRSLSAIPVGHPITKTDKVQRCD